MWPVSICSPQRLGAPSDRTLDLQALRLDGSELPGRLDSRSGGYQCELSFILGHSCSTDDGRLKIIPR